MVRIAAVLALGALAACGGGDTSAPPVGSVGGPDEFPTVLPTGVSLESAVAVLEEPVAFAANAYEPSADAAASLEEKAAMLWYFPDMTLEIIGHESETEAAALGTAADVGLVRALTTKAHLVERGVAPMRLVLGEVRAPDEATGGNPAFAARTVSFRVGSELVAMQPPQPVFVRQFRNGKEWMLGEPMRYQYRDTPDFMMVPEGFVTDFASIPPTLQSLVRQNGPYTMGAIIHDYLYWVGDHGCEQPEADGIFYHAMTENNVPSLERRAMYRAVRWFGDRAWKGNARERQARMPRIVPRERWTTVGANTDWPPFRRALFDEGVFAEQPPPISSAFCTHGASIGTD